MPRFNLGLRILYFVFPPPPVTETFLFDSEGKNSLNIAEMFLKGPGKVLGKNVTDVCRNFKR